MVDVVQIASLFDGHVTHLSHFVNRSAKADMLILHGMSEHRHRYDAFAEAMRDFGLDVYTMDWRGHGESPVDGKMGYFAEENGYLIQTGDLFHVIETIRTQKPFILFAHSMGTLFTRFLVKSHPDVCDLLLLSGAPANNALIPLMLRSLAFFPGKEKPAHVHAYLLNKTYSKSIKYRSSMFDWLSYDRDNVKNFVSDPKCGFPFTVSGFTDLLTLTRAVYIPQEGENRDLPIRFFSGADDPCADPRHDGLQEAMEILRMEGFSDVTLTLYPKSRHEILFDREKETVKQDIQKTVADFLDVSAEL